MRVLVAEDDPLVRELLRQTLGRVGYDVDTVDNGIDAEQAGQKGSYSMVLLDLGLPRLSGIEVLTNWRIRGNWVPIMILTGQAYLLNKIDLFKLKADLLEKPFNVEDLIIRLEALITRGARAYTT